MNDPALEGLWKHVLANWDDDRAHGVFLEHCQRTEQLLEAAVRYRGMAGDHQRGALAKKKLDAVTVLAMAKLETSRRSDRPARSRAGAFGLIAFFVLATIGLLVFLGVQR